MPEGLGRLEFHDVELQPMFRNTCFERLRKLAGGVALARRVYRTTGLFESVLDARIAPIYQKYKNPETTILAKPGQVDVRLTARGKSAEEAERLVQELAGQIETALDGYIFANGEQTLEEIVGMYLLMKQATIAVAESCTGGLLAERLTNVPGSSRYFLSGIVTYSNQSKVDLAGIPPLLLEMQGAVSEEIARGLAAFCWRSLCALISRGQTFPGQSLTIGRRSTRANRSTKARSGEDHEVSACLPADEDKHVRARRRRGQQLDPVLHERIAADGADRSDAE